MAALADGPPGFSLAGDSGMLRVGTPADAIDGVVPQVVAEPQTPEALAAFLRWCNGERLRVIIRGSGTKLGWGQRSSSVDVILGTARLTRVLAHADGDLTATVEAGARVRDFNASLAGHRQWLPVNPAFEAATIGGTIATNDSGSLRHRHGTIRDLLIGMHLATTDGLLVKSGGNVVKNVAGYDLGRLMCGSQGGLAAIVSATFKLAPRPTGSATLIVDCPDRRTLSLAAAAVGDSQLEPVAFDLHVARGTATRSRLLVQFATATQAIVEQIAQARALVAGAGTAAVLAGDEEADAWAHAGGAVWSPGGLVVRLSWLRSSLPDLVALVEDLGRSAVAMQLVGRVAVGAGFLRLDADAHVQAAAIERLCRADVVGNVAVLRADAGVERRDRTSEPSVEGARLLREIKRAFDPNGTLVAGVEMG